METIKVTNIEEKERIDSYIAKKMPELSRTMIKKLIQDGNVLVNGKQVKTSYIVQVGDNIKIEKLKPQKVDIKAQDIPLDIIYEDNDIIVINKPKGMVVHPAAGNYDGTLVNAIMAHCSEGLSGIGGKLRPGIVHRLDKDTSRIINSC